MQSLSVLMNAARRLENMFPGFFQHSPKHDHYKDFGFPKTLTFEHFYAMSERNGFASGAIEKTIDKVWEDTPTIQEDGRADKETKFEAEVVKHFNKIRLWQSVIEADRRSLIGEYAGLVLRFADNRLMNEPVDKISNGLLGLVEVIPAWQGQLEVTTWDTDEKSETYGQPTMFTFNESKVDPKQEKTRQFELHPDRVLVWSKDGTIHGQSLLSAGYNDLITLEKVVGAGGEGFWKNAKSAPVISADKDTDFNSIAASMGIEVDEVYDKMNSQVGDYQKGFDNLLMLQGMTAKSLAISLPQPKEFVEAALMPFAASIKMPVKILVGSQTGERASTEDSREWNKTCNARRKKWVIPNLTNMIDRFVQVGVFPDREWTISWSDLTETPVNEKVDRADKMSDINEKAVRSGEESPAFSIDEIREAAGYDALEGGQNA